MHGNLQLVHAVTHVSLMLSYRLPVRFSPAAVYLLGELGDKSWFQLQCLDTFKTDHERGSCCDALGTVIAQKCAASSQHHTECAVGNVTEETRSGKWQAGC